MGSATEHARGRLLLKPEGQEEAMRITRQVARRLRAASTVEGLRDVPIARTVAATEAVLVRFGRSIVVGDRRALLLSPFRTVHGTETVPVPLGHFARTGTAPDVPLLTGTVRNEAVDLVPCRRPRRNAKSSTPSPGTRRRVSPAML
jgi:carboxylesterase type B